MAVKNGLTHPEIGLPAEAFTVVGNVKNSGTWKLPHHKQSIVRGRRGGDDIEQTVDWEQVALAVAALSPRSRGEQRLYASPEAVLKAATHLAEHYRKAGKHLPDTLAAIV